MVKRVFLILILGCGCSPQSSSPTTTVDFEVTEGTYLSFDVSPDSKTIVFDLLGPSLPTYGETD